MYIAIIYTVGHKRRLFFDSVFNTELKL